MMRLFKRCHDSRYILCLALATWAPAPVAGPVTTVVNTFFKPSFGDVVKFDAEFRKALDQFSAAQECMNDPDCGMPSGSGPGFEFEAGECCRSNAECIDSFDRYLRKIDRALFTLYKNERTWKIKMQVADARMSAMKAAGGMSPVGGAVVARMEADIAKAKKQFIDKFNEKTEYNISRLNDFLNGLGGVINEYCGDSGWYQKNGLPVYLHARTKFLK